MIIKKFWVTKEMLETMNFDIIALERQELENKYFPQETFLDVRMLDDITPKENPE